MLTIIHTTLAPNLEPIFTGCLTPYSALLGSMTNCRQAACVLLGEDIFIHTITCRFMCEDPESAPDGPLSVVNPVGQNIIL